MDTQDGVRLFFRYILIFFAQLLPQKICLPDLKQTWKNNSDRGTIRFICKTQLHTHVQCTLQSATLQWCCVVSNGERNLFGSLSSMMASFRIAKRRFHFVTIMQEYVTPLTSAVIKRSFWAQFTMTYHYIKAKQRHWCNIISPKHQQYAELVSI